MRGTSVCLAHGGGAPQVAEAARRRTVEREAAAELIRLDVEPLDDPLSQLALLAGQAKAWMDVMGERVGTLTSLRYEGRAAGEQLRAEVALFERAMDRCEKFCVSMARLNIDERLTAIGEAQAGLIISFVRAALARFGLDLHDEKTNEIVLSVFHQTVDDDGPVAEPVIELPRGPELTYVCERGMHGNCRAYLQVPGMPPLPPWPQRCPCECHRPTGSQVSLVAAGT